MEQIPEVDPNTQGLKPGQETGALPDAEVEHEQEQYLFYNVMPKVKMKDMVTPKVNVVENTVLPDQAPPNFFQKNKKYIYVAVVAVVLIGAGIWYLYTTFSEPETENILVNDRQTVKPQAITPPTQSPESQPVTTTAKEWQLKYWGSETCRDTGLCSDGADPDRDGLKNVEEYKNGTDPNNADSDQDGLADGDEVYIFLTNPLKPKTSGDPKYNDADYVKGGYDPQTTDKKYTTEQLAQITSRMKQFHLHQPTVGTIGVTILLQTYKFTDDSATTTPGSQGLPSPATTTPTSINGIDLSPEAKQDRDAQRTSTINTLSIALIKYQEDHQEYPQVASFGEMIAAVKPYNRVATNPADPINKDPFVYSYYPEKNGTDFTLSFFSESLNVIIKKHAQDAVKEKNLAEATTLDDQRRYDVENIRTALLLYSHKNVAGNQEYVFPTATKYKSELVPVFLSAIPKDPDTGKDYEYKVSPTFDTFTLKAQLQNPPAGYSGYLCNQEDECRYY